jgi:hypothetical protein
MLLILNLIFVFVFILIVVFYIYAICLNFQDLANKESLINELQILKDHKVILIENQKALHQEIVSRVLKDEKLQDHLLELTRIQSENDPIHLLAAISGALMFIAVIIFMNGHAIVVANTDVVASSAAVTLNANLNSQIQLARMIQDLHEVINLNLTKIEALEAQSLSQITHIMLLNNKIDGIQLALSQGPILEISQEILNMGAGGFGAI